MNIESLEKQVHGVLHSLSLSKEELHHAIDMVKEIFKETKESQTEEENKNKKNVLFRMSDGKFLNIHNFAGECLMAQCDIPYFFEWLQSWGMDERCYKEFHNNLIPDPFEITDTGLSLLLEYRGKPIGSFFINDKEIINWFVNKMNKLSKGEQL